MQSIVMGAQLGDSGELFLGQIEPILAMVGRDLKHAATGIIRRPALQQLKLQQTLSRG